MAKRVPKTGKLAVLTDVKLADLGLTTQEVRFIAYLCTYGIDMVGQAWTEAGFKSGSDTHAAAMGRRLLAKENVQEAINRYNTLVVEPYKNQMKFQLIEYLRGRSFFNVRDFFYDDGSVKPLNELSREALMAVDGVSVRYYGKDATRRVVEYSIANRESAQKMLMGWLDTGKTPKETLPDDASGKVKGLIEKGRRMSLEAKKAAMDGVAPGGTKVTVERMTVEERDGEDKS